MLDIRYIRENPNKVQQNAANKGYGNLSVKELLECDSQKRELQGHVDNLRENRNQNAAKMKGGKPDQAIIDEGKNIKIELVEREKNLSSTDEKFLTLLKKFPNMALDSVPVGKTEDENVEVRRVGEQPSFDFEIKNQVGS